MFLMIGCNVVAGVVALFLKEPRRPPWSLNGWNCGWGDGLKVCLDQLIYLQPRRRLR